jgi:selenocysteine lyase/cysteine desulfurase
VANIEAREDGGTPGFLQAIKTSLAVLLKEKMTTEKMLQAEERLVKIVFEELSKIPKLHILADSHRERLGVFSFYVENVHYNLLVKLLNDRFGIQVRGGCSCAGTYGHYLLHVSPAKSKRITDKIDSGDLSEKPGWVRMSLHPTMTEQEVYYIIEAIAEIVKNSCKWEKDYAYAASSNEFINIKRGAKDEKLVENWLFD